MGTNEVVQLVVVVAQLVEQPLPTPEIHGSNPDIGEILSTISTEENKEKEAWNGL